MEVAASIRPVLDELVGHLHRLYGDRLLRVILYGSHARDEATPASDIDVMVVLRGEVRPFVEISRMAATKAALRLKYEELISVYPLAEASFAKADNSTIASAQREGIELWRMGS